MRYFFNMTGRLFIFRLLILGVCCLGVLHSQGQPPARPTALPHHSLSLQDLSQFKQAKKQHWRLAGNVYADRKQEKHLESTAGTGILVFQPGKKAVPLVTRLEHGDLDLELDFLLPKGSSAAILLQGRYLVHVKDSWLQETLGANDCGGVAAGNAAYAPAGNATKAPGLWQHLQISFLAPRFDESGHKVADARLVSLTLNGKAVQQQLHLAGPAPEALAAKEKPTGPLVLLGQHSPVAFTNIRYKTYEAQRLAPQNLAFQLYKGRFRQLDKLPQTLPFRTGTTDSLSHRLGGEDELLIVEGQIEAPRTGDYLFRVSAGGPAWVFLDNKLVADNQGSRDFERFFYGGTSLTQGKHPFKVIFSNHDQSLVLHYEGPGIPWTPLTTPASIRKVTGQEPLFYPVLKEPVLQRGFLVHGNNTNTYAAAVGIPGGINYAYDLNAQAPLSVWHGDFLNVAHMWRERGEKQLAQPLGAELQLSGLPSLAFLKSETGAWPDSLPPDKSPFTNKGYKLQSNGLPVFFYSLAHMTVEDYLAPAPQQEGLSRQLALTFQPGAGQAYLLLASGHDIEKLPNGAYAVDNKSYYLEAVSGGSGPPILRSSQGKTQLLLPVRSQSPQSTITYSIIW
jgi:hypothetical protein